MLKAFFLPQSHLCSEKDAMFGLFTTHFEGVSRQAFEDDLSHKDWVILLKEEDTLKGFTTLHFYEALFNQEPVRIVYSGDTITDPSIWTRSTLLGQAWMSAVRMVHQGRSEKLYWLLISSGYRTYRFMSVFLQEFYPRYDRGTPTAIAEFMHDLARSQFKNYYNPDQGIIRFPHPQILRSHLQDIPPEKRKDPHVTFFLQKNPGHWQGDELVCLSEFSKSNLTRAGLRLWESEYTLSMPFPISTPHDNPTREPSNF